MYYLFLQRIIKFSPFFLSLYLIACGGSPPLDELKEAKQEITKAKFYNSEKYAPQEFQEARKSLFTAHDIAFNSSPDSDKVKASANNSVNKSRQAIEKSALLYIADLKKESDTSLKVAEDSFAEGLASDMFEDAKLRRKEADELTKSASSKIEMQKARPISEKIALYESYDKPIQLYKESANLADVAKDLSLSQTQQLIDSSVDVDENLNLIERYSEASDREKVTVLRASYDSSLLKMQEGKVKEGFKELEKVRNSTNELLLSTIVPYSQRRIKLASTKIDDAGKQLEGIDPALLDKDAELKASVTNSKDNLSAAKEAQTSSVDLFKKEKYYDSILQSDEAVRLGDIILEDLGNQLKLAKKVQKRSSEKVEEGQPEEATAVENPTEPAKEEEETTPPAPPVKKVAIKKGKTKSAKPAEGKKWTKYVVSPTDTLAKIADKSSLKEGKFWKEIYKVNKGNIKNPHLIYPKQVLLIPGSAEKAVSKSPSKAKKLKPPTTHKNKKTAPKKAEIEIPTSTPPTSTAPDKVEFK